MGFNITGIITNTPLNTIEEIESNLDFEIDYLVNENTSYDEASRNFKEDGHLYVLTSSFGTLLFPDFGYELSTLPDQGEIVIFIVSDVSDTHFFEHYKNGKLTRRLITSEGDIHESIGTAILDDHDEIFLISEELIENYLKIGEDEVYEANFKKYTLK